MLRGAAEGEVVTNLRPRRSEVAPHGLARSHHLTFLLTILALSLLFSAATLYGGEEDWDERHSKWLLALTYPASEENPEEFGKETGE